MPEEEKSTVSPTEDIRLRALESAVTRLTAIVESDLKQTRARLNRVEAHLYGNPEAGEAAHGILITVDRTWAIANRNAKLLWLLGAGVFGALIERVMSLL